MKGVYHSQFYLDIHHLLIRPARAIATRKTMCTVHTPPTPLSETKKMTENGGGHTTCPVTESRVSTSLNLAPARAAASP